MRALVIGGTGPTGYFIVNGLLERGYEVAILHTGDHELDEIPDAVEHIHTNPYDPKCVEDALAGRSFELCVVAYGRLRGIAKVMVGRTRRFISIGGVPAYRGYMNPQLMEPEGLPVPTPEDAPLVRVESDDPKGYRIVRTEEAVFASHPEATHFRYPYLYGPYQLIPREWSIVRRILDGRPHIIVPDGGLTLHHFGYAGNLAHALLLAVDRPEIARGQIYHCADDEVLSLRQVIELIAKELGHAWEIVSLPWELAVPARPLIAQPSTTHRVLDLHKIRRDLDYRDALPAREAILRTAHWLVENPPAPDGQEEMVLEDPFDYAAEDRLVAAWKQALASLPEIEYVREPGLTMAYSGPGGRPRRGDFE